LSSFAWMAALSRLRVLNDEHHQRGFEAMEGQDTPTHIHPGLYAPKMLTKK